MPARPGLPMMGKVDSRHNRVLILLSMENKVRIQAPSKRAGLNGSPAARAER